uniref:Jun dimerization protein 2 n=1 Tax=Ovis aries TaxID=9940 RepID=A0AC11CWC3_SHEEP
MGRPHTPHLPARARRAGAPGTRAPRGGSRSLGSPRGPGKGGALQPGHAPAKRPRVGGFLFGSRPGTGGSVRSRDGRGSLSASLPRSPPPSVLQGGALARRGRRLDEEEERRKRRREKNKVAAARCRNKKKERTEFLQRESERLELMNAELKTQIEELKQERQQLILMLNRHRPTCIVRTDSVKTPESEGNPLLEQLEKK